MKNMNDYKDQEEIHSNKVRAGKRTYFFDVRATRADDYYLTITESKKMFNEDGSPHTAHTTNPVPLIVVDKDIKTVNEGVLGDIAPTILKLLGIEKPDLMTQKSLI